MHRVACRSGGCRAKAQGWNSAIVRLPRHADSGGLSGGLGQKSNVPREVGVCASSKRRLGVKTVDFCVSSVVERGRRYHSAVPHLSFPSPNVCQMHAALYENRPFGPTCGPFCAGWTEQAILEPLGRPFFGHSVQAVPERAQIGPNDALCPMQCLCSGRCSATRGHRARGHSTPWATIASATLTKPAMFAPAMRSPSSPYSLAAASELATIDSMIDLSLASVSSNVQLRR
ncbi:hypothetical protein DSM100685_1043 [Bifidobacterium avesanii]|nr:hypothetical protein DSM100685_1043 [Bifidobacterium avesanii]